MTPEYVKAWETLKDELEHEVKCVGASRHLLQRIDLVEAAIYRLAGLEE